MAASGIKKVFVTALGDAPATDSEGVGTIRKEGSKTYKWVKFTGALAVAVGDFVSYADTVDATTVDKTTAPIGAGVAMAAHAAGSASYGWIQTRGVATLAGAIAGTTPAAGNQVTNTGAANGVVTKAAAVTDCIVGVILHVANKIVQLKCGD